MTNVLFDLGSTYYYVSLRFSSDFNMICDVHDDHIRVSTSTIESSIVTHVYLACPILLMGLSYLGCLAILDIIYVDIIVFMTLLSPYFVLLNRNTKLKEKIIMGMGVQA